MNGSNANCEDPFNPAMSTYIEKCMVPKRGHVGMFPANFCTKIIGNNGKWNTNLFLNDTKCISLKLIHQISFLLFMVILDQIINVYNINIINTYTYCSLLWTLIFLINLSNIENIITVLWF